MIKNQTPSVLQTSSPLSKGGERVGVLIGFHYIAAIKNFHGNNMYETGNELQLFSSLIKINYDKRFIRSAQNFAENLSLAAGANKKESMQISLLIEESLVFIIDKYIDCRSAAHIEICISLFADKKLHIEITDIGPPIHTGMIPSFNVEDENSEAGLWYKLVQGLADGFVFVNRFNSGWLIKIDKNIEDITFAAEEISNEKSIKLSDREKAPAEMQVRIADACDIPGLIDLAYLTYRYTYAMDFYNEELLKKYIENKQYEILIVKHLSRIAGTSIIKYPVDGDKFAELGSAMVAPDYRNGNAMRALLKELIQYITVNPRCCDFFFSTAVTAHVYSQKGLLRINNGFKPLMICLNMIPGAEFIGIRKNTGGRESLLFMYHLNGKLKSDKIYTVSACHNEIINELLTNTGNNINVITEFAEPEAKDTHISIERVDHLKFAVITIEQLGMDWFTSLNRNILSLLASGFESIKVTVPACSPLPANMEIILRDLNLVFTGLSLRSLEDIDLAFCLTTKPVDFDSIKLYDPVSQKLLELIKKSLSHTCN